MPADVSQLLALADEFDQAAPRMAREIVELVSKAADAGVDVARSAAPRRTGRLAASIDKVLTGSGGDAGASARIRATERYAWYVYAGTARQAPQPAFMDSARDAAETVLIAGADAAAQKSLP